MFDFSIIKTAGLTQGEFSSLAGVTRATTNMWVTGKMNPNRYIQESLAELIATITRAIDNDQLPLPANTPKDKRAARLCEVIQGNRAETSPQ